MRLLITALFLLPGAALAGPVAQMAASLPEMIDSRPKQIEEPGSADDYFVLYAGADRRDALAVSLTLPADGPLSGAEDPRLTEPAAQAIADLAREGGTAPAPRQIGGAICGDAALALELDGALATRLAGTCYAAVKGVLVVVSDNTPPLPAQPSEADLSAARATLDAHLAQVLTALAP